MRYDFKTSGTCARVISFDLEEGNIIRNVTFQGGCNGNLKALSRVCEGKTAEEIAELFSGITCNGKSTSCSDQLARAMRLGKLGEQIVIKSKFAFSHLKYEGFDLAEKSPYYVLRKARNDEANKLYLDMLEEENDGLYIQDIMRGGITNHDPRIPRNVSE